MPTQAGDTWLTVKTTRLAWGRTKVKVVVRRRFGPDVPIHGRDELKWSTRSRRDDDPSEPLEALELLELPESEPPELDGPPETEASSEGVLPKDPVEAATDVLVPATWDSDEVAVV